MEVVFQVEEIGWTKLEKHKPAWCVKVIERERPGESER